MDEPVHEQRLACPNCARILWARDSRNIAAQVEGFLVRVTFRCAHCRVPLLAVLDLDATLGGSLTIMPVKKLTKLHNSIQKPSWRKCNADVRGASRRVRQEYVVAGRDVERAAA
jgi:hypothetical protein